MWVFKMVQDIYLLFSFLDWLCLAQSLKGYTTIFFMFILTEHEIYHAHKC